MERIPKPNEIYRHFKGNLYKVLTLARHTETGELLVIYQALYGSYEVFARPLAMFAQEVDREKYPDAGQTFRFEKIPDGMGQAVPPSDTETAGEPQPPEGSTATASVRQLSGSIRATAEARQQGNGTAAAPLMEFLDADSYETKLEVLASMREQLDDEMISTMAMALDVEVEEGRLEERYQSLKNCLLMLDRFECSRLR